MREMTQDEMIQHLRELVSQSSQKELAESLGLAPQTVNDLLRGKRDFSERIANALGFTRLMKFKKIA